MPSASPTRKVEVEDFDERIKVDGNRFIQEFRSKSQLTLPNSSDLQSM